MPANLTRGIVAPHKSETNCARRGTAFAGRPPVARRSHGLWRIGTPPVVPGHERALRHSGHFRAAVGGPVFPGHPGGRLPWEHQTCVVDHRGQRVIRCTPRQRRLRASRTKPATAARTRFRRASVWDAVTFGSSRPSDSVRQRFAGQHAARQRYQRFAQRYGIGEVGASGGFHRHGPKEHAVSGSDWLAEVRPPAAEDAIDGLAQVVEPGATARDGSRGIDRHPPPAIVRGDVTFGCDHDPPPPN